MTPEERAELSELLELSRMRIVQDELAAEERATAGRGNGASRDADDVRVVPSPANPMGVAREVVNALYMSSRVSTLRYHCGDFYQWNGTCWPEIDQRDLRAAAYTLLETRALRRMLPLCEERGIGVIAAAPYASGWLATQDESTTYMYGPAPDDIVERSRRMQAICARHGVALAAAALQFPLAHPLVAAVIPGAKTPREATQNHRHLHTEVPRAVWESFQSEGLLDPRAPTPDIH